MAKLASHRTGLLVSGVVGILVYRAARSGKLTSAWSAVWGAPSGSNVPNSSPSAGSSTGTGMVAPTVPGQYLGSNIFGFTPTYTKPQTAWLAADRGLVPGASEELNYGTGGQSIPFTLPKGDTYELVKQQGGANAGLGGYEVWQALSSGALLGFLHLQQVFAGAVGSRVAGGSPVGKTGWPLAPQYAVGGITGPANAHLAVILDPKAQAEFGL